MKHAFLISFVLCLVVDSLMAQKETNPSSSISFRFDLVQARPLIVIDGFVCDSTRLNTISTLAKNVHQITDINPDDVDTITVLKNDTAVNLYGEMARKGVLIITTKKRTG